MEPGLTTIEAQIRAHTQCIKSGQIEPFQGMCTRCTGTKVTFKRHDIRRRSFRFIIENYVYTIVGYLLRWKCSVCHKTFTEMPSFALPYKRYVTEVIVTKSEVYLHDPFQTTRTTVCYKGIPIAYCNTPEGQIDERQLAHSTLWRWTAFLGNLPIILKEGLSFIRETAPETSFFREIIPIASLKYRSEERKVALEFASCFIRAHRFLKNIFVRSLFPRFETALE